MFQVREQYSNINFIANGNTTRFSPYVSVHRIYFTQICGLAESVYTSTCTCRLCLHIARRVHCMCPDDETVQMSGGKDRQVQGALNYKDFAQVYTLQFRSLNTYYN